MKHRIVTAVALLMVSATSAQGQVVRACVNAASGEIKVREVCQAGWTAITLFAGAAAGGRLVGERTWTSNAFVPGTAEVQILPDSTFSATTNGGPLLINTMITLLGPGGENQGIITCYPVIDGQWAGVYGGLPTRGSAPFDKEGLIVLQRFDQTYHLWTPSRVYTGVSPGTHTFGLRCGGSVGGAFGPTGFSAGAGVPAALSVVELSQ